MRARSQDATAKGHVETPHEDEAVGEYNPFEYDTPVDSYELAKMVFMFVSGIAVVRFIVFSILLLMVLLLTMLANLGLSKAECYERPFSRWRRALLVPVAWMCRAALFVFGFYRVSVKGRPSPDAAFITPNHVSLFDAMAMYWLTMPSAVAKAELLDKPIFGRIFRGLQVIPVIRETKEGREETKRTMTRFANSQSDPDPRKRFPQVLIFPQGTCTKNDCVSIFQRGAFLPGLPVQPVALKYRYKHFNPAYVCTRMKDYFHRRHFTQFVQHLEVVFLPVHYPTQAEKEDPTLFANAVREEIAKELGASMTNHYFEDCKLFQAALDRRQAKHVLAPLEKRRPIDNVFLNGLQLKEIKDIFGDSGSHLSEIKAALKVFEAFDTNDDSTIDFEEFCKATGCPPESSLSKVLFDFCDRDDSGSINFRDLVLSMALTSSKATNEEKARLAFRVLDSDEDGFVSGQDIGNLLELSQGGSYTSAKEVEPELKAILETAREKGASRSLSGEPLLDWELFSNLIKDKPALVNCAISQIKHERKLPDFDAALEIPSPSAKSKHKKKK